MMKFILVLCALIAVVSCRPEEKYPDRYDDFDVQPLVQNPRLLTAYGNCFLSKGPCTPEGNAFRKTIPDAVQTSCSKCTRKQRALIRTVIRALRKDTPHIWQELVQKEDPKGDFKEVLEKFMNGTD